MPQLFGTANMAPMVREPPPSPDNPGMGIGVSSPPGRDTFKGPGGPGTATHYAPGSAPEDVAARNATARADLAARQARHQAMQQAVRQFGGDTAASRGQYRNDFWQRVPGYGWERRGSALDDPSQNQNAPGYVPVAHPIGNIQGITKPGAGALGQLMGGHR